MRKKTYLFSTGVILIALLIALTGCGGGASAGNAEAKAYMEEGDGFISEYESNSGSMSGGAGRMQPPEDYNPGSDLSDEEMEELRSEREAGLEASKEQLENAKASYQKILSLEDAGDYGEYAEVMLELVAAYENNMEMREERTAGFEEEGGPTDVTASDIQERASEMSVYREEIENLKSEAEKIKEDRDL